MRARPWPIRTRLAADPVTNASPAQLASSPASTRHVTSMVPLSTTTVPGEVVLRCAPAGGGGGGGGLSAGGGCCCSDGGTWCCSGCLPPPWSCDGGDSTLIACTAGSLVSMPSVTVNRTVRSPPVTPPP